MKDVKLLVCTENLQSLITKLLKIRNVSVLWVSILKGEILLDMNNFNDIPSVAFKNYHSFNVQKILFFQEMLNDM